VILRHSVRICPRAKLPDAVRDRQVLVELTLLAFPVLLKRIPGDAGCRWRRWRACGHRRPCRCPPVASVTPRHLAVEGSPQLAELPVDVLFDLPELVDTRGVTDGSSHSLMGYGPILNACWLFIGCSWITAAKVTLDLASEWTIEQRRLCRLGVQLGLALQLVDLLKSI
jgi:hypothetical protein